MAPTEKPSKAADGMPTDVAGLAADYDEILALLNASQRSVGTPTSDDADRIAVIADNFVSCMNLAGALGELIDSRNHEGSMVVFRALYETCINLMYLYDIGDRTRNALLARAYALKEIAENYAVVGAREIAREHRRLFDKMPRELRLELEQNRKRERNHWSGVSLAARAERVGFKGHRVLYRGTSWEAHALAVGRLPFVQTGEDRHQITLHRALTDKDAEGLARLARLCLRQAWARLANEFLGSAIPLSASAPDPTPRAPSAAVE